MKTKQYILAVILSLTMSVAIASGEGVIVNSPGNDAAMVMDFKNFMPVVPMTASFEEVPVLDDMISQSSSLSPVVPMEAPYSESL